MSKKTRATYSPEFRLEIAQEGVDKHRSIREVSEAFGLGKESPLSINGHGN